MGVILNQTVQLEQIYAIIDGSILRVSDIATINIRDYGFYKYSSLTSAIFPNAISIGNYGFYQCTALEQVSIPVATSIGDFAFRGCSALTSIDLPAVTTIGQGCFDECIALSSATLPFVATVKPLTFRKCESLTSVDFSSVTGIGTQAFYSSGITSLTLRSNTVVALENVDAFYFTPIENGVGYIYVPSNLVDSYKAADGWSTYANQIRAIA